MTFLYYREGTVAPMHPWKAKHQKPPTVTWLWGTKRRALQRAQIKRLKMWRREL